MKLYDYILTESLKGDNLLIITIDLGDDDLIFNNVDIYIQDLEQIHYAMKLIYLDDELLPKYLEKLYHNEIDPHKRGEN